MADAVSTRILHDDARNVVIEITNLSDGTGESGVIKLDTDGLSGTPETVRLEKVEGNVSGTAKVSLFFDASSAVKLLDLGGSFIKFDFSDIGGIPDPKATGFTGDILLTTTGFISGSSYALVLHFKKKYKATVYS